MEPPLKLYKNESKNFRPPKQILGPMYNGGKCFFLVLLLDIFNHS